MCLYVGRPDGQGLATSFCRFLRFMARYKDEPEVRPAFRMKGLRFADTLVERFGLFEAAALMMVDRLDEKCLNRRSWLHARSTLRPRHRHIPPTDANALFNGRES